MFKKVFLSFLIIFIVGIFVPLIYSKMHPLPSDVVGIGDQVMEPLNIFVYVPSKNTENQINRCNDKNNRMIIQSYTWMMIPGSEIEICFVKDSNGEREVRRAGMLP